jgi:hypothetical protein
MPITEKNSNLTIREKLVLHLVIFLIQMIHPWEYSHQYDKFWNELKELIK